MEQDEHGNATDGSDNVARGGKLVEDAVNTRAGLGEEVEEHWNLQEEHDDGDDEHQ